MPNILSDLFVCNQFRSWFILLLFIMLCYVHTYMVTILVVNLTEFQFTTVYSICLNIGFFGAVQQYTSTTMYCHGYHHNDVTPL